MPSDMVRALHQVSLPPGFTKKEETEGRVKQLQKLVQLRMPMAREQHRWVPFTSFRHSLGRSWKSEVITQPRATVRGGAGTVDLGECQRLCESCLSLHSAKSCSFSRVPSRRSKCASKARAHLNHRLLGPFLLALEHSQIPSPNHD